MSAVKLASKEEGSKYSSATDEKKALALASSKNAGKSLGEKGSGEKGSGKGDGQFVHSGSANDSIYLQLQHWWVGSQDSETLFKIFKKSTSTVETMQDLLRVYLYSASWKSGYAAEIMVCLVLALSYSHIS